MKTIVIYALKDEELKTFNARVFENEEKAEKYIKLFKELWTYYWMFNNVSWITI